MENISFWNEFADKILPLYIESARSYAQLSIGALILTMAFHEKVLGEHRHIHVNRLLVLSWASLLVAIGASAWYQYVAVKLIELIKQDPAGFAAGNIIPYFPLSVEFLWPGYAYGTMVTFFFLGAVLLVIASAKQLLNRKLSAT